MCLRFAFKKTTKKDFVRFDVCFMLHKLVELILITRYMLEQHNGSVPSSV